MTAEGLAVGEVAPQPYLVEEGGIHGGGLQEGLHQPLEARALVLLGEGLTADLVEDVGERGGHGVVVLLPRI